MLAGRLKALEQVRRAAAEHRQGHTVSEYRERKFYLPGWLYDAAVADGLDKRVPYWHLVEKYPGTVNPKEELLMRLNATQRGEKNPDPVNWPGRRGFLTSKRY